jgi:acetyl esterase/lipase
MTIDRRTLIGAAASLAVAGAAEARPQARARAQRPPAPWGAPTPAAGARDRPAWPPREHFRLWPGTPPGAPALLPPNADTMNGPPGERQLWLRGVAQPIVAVYRPQHPDGSALLVIPGGGYGFLSIQNEGIDIANTFTPRGVTVFVLAYRLPAEGWTRRWDVPLQDAQRAIRLIRAEAARWRIDPEKLGALGFSAGGHLGASLAVGYDDQVYRPIDAADRQSARPVVAGLLYPVISITADRKGGSYTNLIGPDAGAAPVARYETDRRVTSETPPLFLAQALDDDTVNPQNSIAMLNAAREARVPVEAHLFEKGGHGFGVKHVPKTLPASRWPELFDLWRRTHLGLG